MKKKGSRSTVILPPPAETILLYAADGLSSWRGHLSPAGRPRTPSRALWVPMFRQLVDSSEGLVTIHSLAEEGMRAWGCPPSMVGCLEDALRDITFRALSIAALQHFADTSREKIVLPIVEKPAPRHPQPESPRPRPERPHHHRPGTSPHRPRSRPGSMTPAPH